MKTTLLSLLFVSLLSLFIPIFSLAQTTITYTYDTAGNRTGRSAPVQTGLGYDYTQFRNAFGSSIDRVDYLGGVTFATNEYFSGTDQGVTIGDYCNLDIIDVIGNGSFIDYVKTHPLYMHEYGHTIDSRSYGPAYLFAVGIPSFISAKNATIIPGTNTTTHDYKSYEMRANRIAERYFGLNYAVLWETLYGANYPTHL